MHYVKQVNLACKEPFFLFEGKKVDPLVSMAKAEIVLDSYKRVKIPSSSHLENKLIVKQQQWKPPPQGWLKINVDAAINIEKQVAGLGMVLRDFNGSFIAATVKSFKFYGNVIFAESEAVEWSLQVAKTITMSSIMVEIDSQGVYIFLICSTTRRVIELKSFGWYRKFKI